MRIEASSSDKYKTNLLRSKALAEAPIVEIVMEVAVSRHKFKLDKELFVIHDIKSIEDVKAAVLGLNQSGFHKLMWLILG